MKFSWKIKNDKTKAPTAVDAALGRFATTVDSPIAPLKRSLGISQPNEAGKTTIPQIPAKQILNGVSAAISAAAHRERRSDERRHGRADQRAPGTRTRMLKIIYDKRKDYFMLRRKALVLKSLVAIVILGAVSYGGYQVYHAASTTTSKVVSKVDPNGWWKNVSQSVSASIPASTKSAAPAATPSKKTAVATKKGTVKVKGAGAKTGKKVHKAKAGKPAKKLAKIKNKGKGSGKGKPAAKQARAKKPHKKSKKQLAKR